MTIDVAPAVTVPEVQHISGEARLEHDGWVSEFEAFQWSADARNSRGTNNVSAVPASSRSSRTGRSAAASRRGTDSGGGSSSNDPNRGMDDLRAEIKLLHWHKLANEAALKAALLKTKKIKAQGGGHARPVPATSTLAMPIEERAAWMQQIIEEEQSKPLQVTKDFVARYEAQEKDKEGRLDSEVAGHIRSLRNLRKQIEKREAMKDRREKYRSAQKQLEVQKQRLLLGKLTSKDEGSTTISSTNRVGQDLHGIGAVASGGAGAAPRQGPQQTVGALNTVLGSLDKLVELEKRISSLEKSNVYDDFLATRQCGAESVTAGQLPRRGGERRRSSGSGMTSNNASVSSRISRARANGAGAAGARRSRLSFSKQRMEATVGAPSKVYYAVRVSNRGTGSTSGNGASRRGRPLGTRGSGGILRPRAETESITRSTGGSSTFLTQLPDVHARTRKMGARAVGAACGSRVGGAVAYRSAVAEKKRLEAKRRVAGDRAEALRIARQDRIIREWIRRKKAAAATGCRQRKSSVLSREADSAFLASGRRTRPRPGGAVGFAASRRANNVHLQEFRDIRAQYAKRTEKLRKDLPHRRRGSESAAFMAGTRTPSVARPRAAAGASKSVIPSRPPLKSRARPVPLRGRGTRTAAGLPGVSSRRNLAIGVGGRPKMRRRREEVGLAVGGTGVRAARARRQQASSENSCFVASASDRASGTGGLYRTRRANGPRSRRETDSLRQVGKVGRGAEGGDLCVDRRGGRGQY